MAHHHGATLGNRGGFHDQVFNPGGRHRIETSRGLVVEQQGHGLITALRIVDQGPGKTHPLLHSATQLPGIQISHIKQSHFLQAGLHPFTDVLFGQSPLLAKQETNVLPDRERRQQGGVLEHQAHIRRIVLVQAQIALRLSEQSQFSLGGHLQPSQQSQHRGLSRTGRAHHCQSFAGLHVEIDGVQNPS